ncbi:MAG: hypothetical protein HQL96_05445 [Magnetococcales bacterium]|nr:hypothetical protein [Magnetococcales bacterium]
MNDTPSEAGTEQLLDPIFNNTSPCIATFLLVWCFTMGLHSWVLWEMILADLDFYSSGALTSAQIILNHMVIVFLVGLAGWVSRWSGCGQALFLLLAGATAVLGFIGILGTLLAFVLFLDYQRSAKPLDDWHEQLFPKENRQQSEELVERLQVATADTSGNLSPFLDILAFGSQAQKLTMISMITRHFRPAFSRILLEAVNAPDNAIRVQAATAVSYLENRFVQESMALEQRLLDSGNDPKRALDVALHYDEYAFSGLLDPLRAKDTRDKALHYYRLFLAKFPDHADAVHPVARLLIKNGCHAEAAEFLHGLLAHGAANETLLVWYMETLYRLGRFDELNQVAHAHWKRFRNNASFPIRIVETIALWAGRDR